MPVIWYSSTEGSVLSMMDKFDVYLGIVNMTIYLDF